MGLDFRREWIRPT